MDDPSLNLSDDEIAQAFADPYWAAKFPPFLTIQMAAELLQQQVGTIRDWRSRGMLEGCSRRKGKRVLFDRNRLIKWFFNEK